jgi:hypothetical protein
MSHLTTQIMRELKYVDHVFYATYTNLSVRRLLITIVFITNLSKTEHDQLLIADMIIERNF